MKKYIVFLLLIASCASKPNKVMIRISLTDSSQSLKITGLGDDILQEIDRDSVTTGWLSLIPVYRMPKDTDMKDFQSPQPGKYVVTDSTVVFTPDTPFISQQTYFVRYYQYDEGNDIMEYVQHRKKLGQVPFTDLVFKR
jgi:hypothetical protein